VRNLQNRPFYQYTRIFQKEKCSNKSFILRGQDDDIINLIVDDSTINLIVD